MVRVSLAMTAALSLAACDLSQKCQTQAAAPPPSSASQTTAAQVPSCAKGLDKAVALTRIGAQDRLTVEALGPDCANPALLARVYDAKGRLLFAHMTSGKWLLSTEMFPVGQGNTQGVTENLYDVVAPSEVQLPPWRAGASAPDRGHYGAFDALVPQPFYERMRAANLPVLIQRGGGESGTFYMYNPDSGEVIAIAAYAV